MSVCSEISDYEWLTEPAAQTLLAELAAQQAPLHTTIDRLRRLLSPARAHLAAEQIDLRRRAATKFSGADRMFFTRVGLEQATDEWIAAYKAGRINARTGNVNARSAPQIADLCSGIGGDLIALAATGFHATAIDRDPIAAHLAAANLSALGLKEKTTLRCADVASFDLAQTTAWHIDPDRRPGGRRTTSLEKATPGIEMIGELLARSPNAAIKLAPATEVPEHWRDTCELEWISRDRECRQLVAWHGTLAIIPGTHRATIIAASREGMRTEPAATPRTLTGAPNMRISIVDKPDRYIFDTDPAIRAAHLTGALASDLHLSALAAGPTYLTGPNPLPDDLVSCFEVRDVLRLRTKLIADYLRKRNIGRLEIKTRGVEANPEKMRHELKLTGDNSATLLIQKIASRPTAILAQRVTPTSTH